MNNMKKLLLLTAALASSGLSLAQELAQVISSTPLLQQVAVPRQVCSTEQPPNAGTEATNQQNCTIQNFYEQRAVAYNVIYIASGKQYTVQLPYDPGPSLQVQVSPQVTQAPMYPNPGTVTYTPTQYGQAVYVVPSQTVYPGYYEPNYFLPFAVGLGFGLLGGFHGHGYRR